MVQAGIGGQLAGVQVGFQGIGYAEGDRRGGLKGGGEANERQGVIYAYRNGLGGGTAIAAIRLTVIPQDHCSADLPLREVILERHIGMIQEREDMRRVLPQTFRQSPGRRCPPSPVHATGERGSIADHRRTPIGTATRSR